MCPGSLGSGARRSSRRRVHSEARTLAALRDRLWRRILAAAPDARINGDPAHRLPNTLNVLFPSAAASDLLAAAPGIAASAGSACTSARPEPSHVLLAMGLDAESASCSVRCSLGRFTTAEEVERAGESIAFALASLRSAAAHA
ncbi:MAG: aminotransferase class V-fold PLP-dependent enzyme [Chloroflexia bacterium]